MCLERIVGVRSPSCRQRVGRRRVRKFRRSWSLCRRSPGSRRYRQLRLPPPQPSSIVNPYGHIIAEEWNGPTHGSIMSW
ncbi:unnamed protein product [Nezara viridula]|uniref:Uncharacterized protein n=1 Tax=Nezara viridula TaxID=85310 RepID=A0A9P0HIH9_NEZVI|nr:unnamed protein product [Nezara viridula]